MAWQGTLPKGSWPEGTLVPVVTLIWQLTLALPSVALHHVAGTPAKVTHKGATAISASMLECTEACSSHEEKEGQKASKDVQAP